MLEDGPSVFYSLRSWQTRALMSSAYEHLRGSRQPSTAHSTPHPENLWNACEPQCLQTDSENKMLLTKDLCTCNDSDSPHLPSKHITHLFSEQFELCEVYTLKTTTVCMLWGFSLKFEFSGRAMQSEHNTGWTNVFMQTMQLPSNLYC